MIQTEANGRDAGQTEQGKVWRGAGDNEGRLGSRGQQGGGGGVGCHPRLQTRVRCLSVCLSVSLFVLLHLLLRFPAISLGVNILDETFAYVNQTEEIVSTKMECNYLNANILP